MIVFRRLLSGLIALALVQFGAVATAPAHAHAEGEAHGVREVVLAHGHAHADDGHGSGHDRAGGHHDEDHHDADIAGDAPSDEAPHGAPGGEHAAHVHGCPQIAPVDVCGVEHAPAFGRAYLSPWASDLALSHASYPPLRPPRAIL